MLPPPKIFTIPPETPCIYSGVIFMLAKTANFSSLMTNLLRKLLLCGFPHRKCWPCKEFVGFVPRCYVARISQ